MTIYICNAFSLSMLDRNGAQRAPTAISLETAKRFARAASAVSAVGHADTAAVFSEILGVPVICDRITVKLTTNDLALIGQLTGPRLPEGCKTLPENATIEWWII